MCGLAAVGALMAGIAAVALAQNPGTGAPPPDPPGRLPNQDLHVACGIRIMLVLDESSSMTATDLTLTRTAATAFVNGLRGTGTELAMTAFALRARDLVTYRVVNNTTAPQFTTALQAANNGFGNPTSPVEPARTGRTHSGWCIRTTW